MTIGINWKDVWQAVWKPVWRQTAPEPTEQPAGKAHKRKLPRKIFLRNIPVDVEEEIRPPELKAAEAKPEIVKPVTVVSNFDGSAGQILKGAKIDNKADIEIINRYSQEIDDEERFILYLATQLD